MRCLILPCETRVREFDAKLLLAVVAADQGITSIIGAKKTIDLHLSRYPAGIYIGKSLTDRSRLSLAMPRLCGHLLALWDEEGLVWASRDIYWKTKVHPANLRSPDLLLAWGECNASAWREHPDYSGTPVAVTGNPRTDLLHPRLRDYFRDDVAAIRHRYGSFVLINTNFSRVNNIQPRQNRHKKWLRLSNHHDTRAGFARHKYRLYMAFLSMLPVLAKALPETRFIIRPHPSESYQVWRDLANKLPNVDINNTGNVIPWLLAADLMIHNGCTTAVEAYLLECPAIAYMPLRSPFYDHPLPNGISLQADDIHALTELVRHGVHNRETIFSQQSSDILSRGMINHSIAGLDEDSTASERICRALHDLLQEQADTQTGWRLFGETLLALRRCAYRLAERVPGTAQYRPYIAHMFPYTPSEQVQKSVKQLTQCLGITHSPCVEQVQDNVFKLSPRQL